MREKVIKEIVCPVCGEPDTANIDLAEKHFEFLDMKVLLDQMFLFHPKSQFYSWKNISIFAEGIQEYGGLPYRIFCL